MEVFFAAAGVIFFHDDEKDSIQTEKFHVAALVCRPVSCSSDVFVCRVLAEESFSAGRGLACLLERQRQCADRPVYQNSL